MIKSFGQILTGVALVGLAGGAALTADRFTARLSGDAEVPLVMTGTSGQARVVFDDDEASATFRLKVNDGVRITQAHLHCAPEGVAGPVVAFLAAQHAPGWDIDGVWINNATLTDANVIPTNGQGPCPEIILDLRDLAEAIRAGNIYVNVHSSANPAGEVRGQLAQVGTGNADGDDDDDDDDAAYGDDDDDDSNSRKRRSR